MRKCILILLLAFLPAASVPAPVSEEECTTAVITGAAAADGKPILWKNRDTDQLSNKVVFVDEKPYSYLAVVNAGDNAGRIAWGGLNARGFAIINSVAYNLPQKSGESADLEGIVMADALRTCASAGDFEEHLNKNLGPDFGCRTNFCVIDAHGGAAIFEVHNNGYKRLNAAETSEKYLLNTNFSRSGTADQGAGYLRFDREVELFKSVPAGKLSHELVLQTLARDLGHSLLRHPGPAEWKMYSADQPVWIHTNYTINRPTTASTILIHGVKEGEDPLRATLWVILGEPICSIALPIWVAAGETPEEVRSGKDAAIYREAARLQNMLRPLKGRDRREYIDLTRLDNKEGKGWLPGNLKLEKEILTETATLMRADPTPAQLHDFQNKAASRVLSTLKSIQ